MQGRQQYEPRLFSAVNLEEMIPKNHILFKIDKVIDFNFIYDLTSNLYCSSNGRPSIDPVIFFRMQLIGYLFGIQSDRKLCEHIHLNLAYRWFCQMNLEDSVPNHSSLTRIRDRFSVETYKAIFEKIVRLLQEKGLIKSEKIMVDASLVEADASIDSLKERKKTDQDQRELKKYEKRYHDFKEGKKERRVSNQTHVSKTDPDSTLVSRPGTYRKLYYKLHYAIEDKNRFILDCFATTGARHECKVLPDRLNYLLNDLKIPVSEVIADKGYGRGPTYSFLRKEKIRAYIPLHDHNLGKGRLTKTEFIYDRKNDRYICPGKKFLYPYEKLDHGLIKRYRVLGGHCKTCHLKSSCLPEKYKQRARFMYRSPYQDEIDKIKKRQKSVSFKKKLKDRQWKLEGLFGEAKVNHCLRRAKNRGLDKVQIQFYMTAITQNLKRLIIGRLNNPLWRVSIVFYLRKKTISDAYKGFVSKFQVCLKTWC